MPLLAGVAGVALCACSEVAVERRDVPQLETVEAVVALEVTAAHRLLAAGLPAALAAHRDFRALRVAAFGEDIFPQPQQMQLLAADNPALARYAALTDRERRHDFYLYDLGDNYWKSEYEAGGEPVRFKTDFLIHLEATGDGGTRVEVIEYLPVVWPGEVFRWLGHHGPGSYHDIRRVAPTTTDRLAMLEIVRGLLAVPADDEGGTSTAGDP